MQLDLFTHSQVYDLSKWIDYAPGAVISKIVSKKQTGNITLFSFDKGQGLSEHSAPFDAFIQVLDGEATVIINGKGFLVKTNESIILPANIPHAVQAHQQFKMLLTMIKSS